MNKLTSSLLLLCLCLTGLQAQIQTDKLSGGLFEAYQSAEANDYLPVFLLLSDRIDMQAMGDDLDRKKASLQERAYTVLTSLQEKAKITQAPLLQLLEGHAQVRESSIKSLWIANMVSAEVQPALIEALSQDKRIAFLELDSPIELVADVEERPFVGPMDLSPNGIEAGLAVIGAPNMWEMGYTGYGTKALIMDTGVDTKHRALWNHYYGHYAPDQEAWTGYSERPFDCESHGTHVAGTVLGVDRASNDTIGVAFNGLWMAAPPIGCGWVNSSIGTFETMQWAMNPDNNPNTIEDMPDVINNSWTNPYDPGSECFNGWSDMLLAVEAAGIANIFAASNNGPGESTLTSPQNVNANLINCFTVAAVNGNLPDLPIADFSSRGPSLCAATGSLLIKPEVSAPGVFVRSSFPGNQYGQLSGTSMASPHVAGAVLLLKEAFPDIPGKEIMYALYYSAIDLGEVGEDNTYGNGIINLPNAYQYLLDEGFTPVTPASHAYDAMILDAQVSPVSCENLLDVKIQFENGGDSLLQNLQITYQFDDPANTSGVLSWDGQLARAEQAEAVLEDLNTPAEGSYMFTVTLSDPNGLVDDRPMNNQIRQRINVVGEEPMAATYGIDGSDVFCADQPALLNALPNAEGRVEWYDESTEGNLLGEGKTFLTDTLTENTTFYADFFFNKSVGVPINEFIQTTAQEPGEGLIFDVYHPITIKSVKTVVEETGARIIKVLNSEGNTIKQKIINIQETGTITLELNFSLEAKQDYELVVDLGKPLGFFAVQGSFPKEIPGIMSITSGTSIPFYYYYFFDWEVEYAHPCGRTPVPVEVSASDDPPSAAFAPSTTFLDITDGLTPITFTDASVNAVSWTWDFGDGNQSNLQNPSHTYTEPGIYNVILSVKNADGCSNAISMEIEIFEEVPLSTEKIETPIEIRFFPNPVASTGQLWVDLPPAVRGTIQLFNLMGQTVAPAQSFQGAWNTEISFTHLPKGVYLLQVQTEIGIQTQKIIYR